MAERKTLAQLKQQQRFLQIAIFSLVTVFIWIGLSIYRSQQETQVESDLQELARPLTPTINTAVIDRLETAEYFDPAELRDFPIYKLIISQNTGLPELVTIDIEEETETAQTPIEEQNQKLEGGGLSFEDEGNVTVPNQPTDVDVETEPATAAAETSQSDPSTN